MSTTTTAAPIAARDYQASVDVRERNAHRAYNTKHVEECFLCGRGLTERAVDNGWAVHLRTDGRLLPVGEPFDSDPDSQGWFPVGSECAKRVPTTHRAR